MSHGKRPAFQFYPRDWLTDDRLRSCSPAARGVWTDLMAIMHFSEPYGHLARDGQPVPDAAVARQIGESPASYRRLLKELEEAGVSSRTPGGILYSRRMVRDERVRMARALGGELSATNPNVPRAKEPDEEGYPLDTERTGERISSATSTKDTFGGSPAAAAASSSAPAEISTTAAARAELLRRLAKEPGRHDVIAFLETVPDHQQIAWIRILIGCLTGQGMPGMVESPTSALATACREFPAIADKPWKPRHFKACVTDAMRTALAHVPKVPRSPAMSRTERAFQAAREFAAGGDS